MQSTFKFQARRPVAALVAPAQVANAPMLLNPELLKFIGGGKGVTTTTTGPSAPKNGW